MPKSAERIRRRPASGVVSKMLAGFRCRHPRVRVAYGDAATWGSRTCHRMMAALFVSRTAAIPMSLHSTPWWRTDQTRTWMCSVRLWHGLA